MFGINFRAAFNGLWKVITSQRTFKVHLIIASIVILAAFYFNFNQTEWMMLILTISLVLTAETFNTAIEILTDSKKFDHKIKIIKDVSAGAVIITVITSIIVGIILFHPKILMLLN